MSVRVESQGLLDLARAYSFLFIANLIQNDMRGKQKRNHTF